MSDSAAPCRLQRLHRDASRPEDQHALVTEIAEHPFGQCERHRAGGGRVRADRGLGTRAPTGCDSRAEEQRKHRPRRSGGARFLERVADLPENLGLAEHERVEAGRNPAEMTRDILACVHVEVVGEQTPVDPMLAREDGDQLLARLLDSAGEVRIQLNSIASRE